MNTIALFSLVLTISSVFGQKPVPCTSPPQWEARVFSYDPFQKDTIMARITYDAIYKRERIVEEVKLGDQDDFYDVLYLHNQQIEYRFNFKTKECTKQAITRPWRDFGIPANATSNGESYIGSSAVPNANVLLTLWSKEFTNEKGNKIDYTGAWTYEACLPVSSHYFSKEENINTHTNFFDIVPGIDNPNVFIPRKECLGL
ncbi:unnamed protein product [Brachionus calyciflorus]|uniref:Uncharacterized protein n=1 Tax=Brachionus calyciflorus TaxID=104777 RepID=A0A813ZJR3_9BILA|nr:unnamed protein product [Brachionus calyciflorus]